MALAEKLQSAVEWAQFHWLFVVIAASMAWLFFIFLIGVSWLAGYWLNAMYGMKFEIASCWQGLGVAIGGIPALGGMAAAGWQKYKADSQFNTPEGKPVAK